MTVRVNPASLAAKVLILAPYSAAPWTGTASAGSSGSLDLVSTGADPSAGTAVNGYAPASFNTLTNLQTSTATWDSLFPTNATVAVVFYGRAPQPHSSAPFANPALVTDAGAGGLGVAFDDAGVTGWYFDGVSYSTSQITVACSGSAWHLARMRWNTTTIELSVDSGAWSTLAVDTTIYTSTGLFRAGMNWDTQGLDADIAAIFAIDSRLSDANADGIGAWFQDRFAQSWGFTPDYTPLNLASYPHRIDRWQVERHRMASARQQAYSRPFYPPAGAFQQLQSIRRPEPDTIHRRQDTIRTHVARMPGLTSLSPLPIPTDTTAFAQSLAVYPSEVRGRFYRAATQDAAELAPFQPPVTAYTPLNLSVTPDAIARRGQRVALQDAVEVPPYQPPATLTPVTLTDFPDSIVRPRFGAHLQLHVTSLSPRPERTIALFEVEAPDVVRRPRLAPSAMQFQALPPRPEQKIASGFQGRYPQQMRRPTFDARLQQSTVFWPYPLPDAPVVPVPIVVQDGVVTILSARAGQVAVLSPQGSAVALLTARGAKVVVLDVQSGTLSLLSATQGTVE